jgi:hypothetical protein
VAVIAQGYIRSGCRECWDEMPDRQALKTLARTAFCRHQNYQMRLKARGGARSLAARCARTCRRTRASNWLICVATRRRRRALRAVNVLGLRRGTEVTMRPTAMRAAAGRRHLDRKDRRTWEQLGNSDAKHQGKRRSRARLESRTNQQHRRSGPVCKTSIPGSNGRRLQFYKAVSRVFRPDLRVRGHWRQLGTAGNDQCDPCDVGRYGVRFGRG